MVSFINIALKSTKSILLYDSFRPSTSRAYRNPYALAEPIGVTAYSEDFSWKPQSKPECIQTRTASCSRRNNPHPSQVKRTCLPFCSHCMCTSACIVQRLWDTTTDLLQTHLHLLHYTVMVYSSLYQQYGCTTHFCCPCRSIIMSIGSDSSVVQMLDY